MAREVRVAILGDSRDFSRAVRSVQGDASKLDKSFDGIGRGAARMGKVVALGFGALAVGGAVAVKGFVDAAIESQKVTKQTAAVIKSMGNAANVTSEGIAGLSEKLAMQTGIDDELIQSGSNILLTFGKIRNGIGKTNKIFDLATEAALNMSVALGTDMKSASMLVGKALNDPIRGLTALRRSGIQFTKQQEDQIKWMVANGDTMSAQKIILGELTAQFGGSAAAQATAGDKLKVIWGNLQEQLGEKLLPVFEKVATWLSRALPAAVAVVEPILRTIIGAFQTMFTAFADGDSTVASSGVPGFFADVGEKARTAFDAISNFVTNALGGLSAWWSEHGPAITETLGSVATTIKDSLLPPLTSLYNTFNEKILPKLAELTAWILTNKPLLLTLATIVGVQLTLAFFSWAASMAAAAGAMFLLVAPVAIGVGLLAGLVIVTGKLADKFRGPLLEALQAVVGVLVFILDAIRNLMDMFKDAIKLAGDLAKKVADLPGVNLPGTGGSPLPFDIPGVPWFDNGGIVPGQRGAHSLAMVAGGETILPTHKTNAVSPFTPGGGAVYNINIGRLDKPTIGELIHRLKVVQLEAGA